MSTRTVAALRRPGAGPAAAAASKKPEPEEALEYVGFGARSTAWTVDTLLLALIMIPINMALGLESTSEWDPLSILLKWVLPAAPTIYCWWVYQATPGKMLIRARIVDAMTGEKPTGRQMALRYLGYFASTLPLFLGFIWVAFDPRKQGWHDKIAGTVVIRNRRQAPRPDFFVDRSA